MATAKEYILNYPDVKGAIESQTAPEAVAAEPSEREGPPDLQHGAIETETLYHVAVCWLVPGDATIGQSDRIQTKLQFESRKTPKAQGTEVNTPEELMEGASAETNVDLKQMLVFVQRSLTKIDGNIDALMYRMDRMSNRLDKHAEHLDQVERRVSEGEVDHGTLATAQKKVDRLLLTLQAKAADLEALEASSCRNNVHIVGIAESTEINNMEQYVEQMLSDLLGLKTFSDIFVVEWAHCSLPPGAPVPSHSKAS
ncbi:hypothetical protein NDU88_001306 [Pleurodeles waltl]|uniref:Uncharacterized protein n=1 Tax=Pleurodeles waltl TaxID=8319 RepID=A0AAV7LAW1_PLEWA|nr:hypothetical protein NDU88_001306 [Pleurodeles waltl]